MSEKLNPKLGEEAEKEISKLSKINTKLSAEEIEQMELSYEHACGVEKYLRKQSKKEWKKLMKEVAKDL